MTNDYCTSFELRQYLGDGGDVDEVLIQAAATVASRRIETLCGRTFNRDQDADGNDITTIKYFDPDNWYQCDFIDDAGQQFDLATATGLQVHVDLGYNGSYATAYTADTDFSLNPINQTRFGQPWPYQSMTALSNSGSTFPIRTAGFNPTVKITGTWGWPSVPDSVKQATLALGQSIYKRKDALFDIVPDSALGGVPMRGRTPSIVLDLLEPYILQSRWVA